MIRLEILDISTFTPPVDNLADVMVKFLRHVKNSTERSDYLRLFAYICHAIDDFTCLE